MDINRGSQFASRITNKIKKKNKKIDKSRHPKSRPASAMRRGVDKHRYLQASLLKQKSLSYVPEFNDKLGSIVTSLSNVNWYAEVPFIGVGKRVSSRCDVVGYSAKDKVIVFLEYKTSDVTNAVCESFRKQVKRCYNNFVGTVATQRTQRKYVIEPKSCVTVYNWILLRTAHTNSNGRVVRSNVIEEVDGFNNLNIVNIDYNKLFKDLIFDANHRLVKY